MRLTSGEVLLRWPLSTHILTAGWTYNDGSAHNAIDLRAGAGTPVYAAEGGTVDQLQTWDGHTRTGMQSYGTMVRLRHADYRGQPLQTRYAHLTRVCVKAGQLVREGDLLGYSGQTGNCAGAHLHFEVLLAGVRCNPLNWLDGEFSCASPAVQAHLGVYESVRRPGTPAPARLQRLSIGPVSDGDAMSFWNLAQRLGVPYTAAYVEEG
ncbi:M23 family metallopeptidase [uncultured Subdoligranulum sp.]|uniref:M23 family metallopeptidase n=1 Tax=uncultured Subdoligranulum sp. TaxID=512298 RepID=UPI0025F329FD|nr:M23 family metallopeptidase [uncultured Subdoligranulum sp.]